MSARDEVHAAAAENGWTYIHGSPRYSRWERGRQYVVVRFGSKGSVTGVVADTGYVTSADAAKRKFALDQLRRAC